MAPVVRITSSNHKQAYVAWSELVNLEDQETIQEQQLARDLDFKALK